MKHKRRETDTGEVPGPDTAPTGDNAVAYGEEGTNKTIPLPRPEAVPAGEVQGTKTRYVPKSPYTREF